jgi:selenocysteine lyase/cysteine desulfurase
MSFKNPSRRYFLKGMAAGTAAAALPSLGHSSTLPNAPADVGPETLARDEAFWREIGSYYDRTESILNLEHGYWGKMARPVQSAYVDAIGQVNVENSYYARRRFWEDEAHAGERIAAALGAEADEIVITRNATEGIQSLVRQYRNFEPGDAVLIADIDYPAFKTYMRWLKHGRGVRIVELVLPERAGRDEILELYVRAFEANPAIRLALVTHVSNQHGLVIPVSEITAEARRHGIDIVCDAAQSWGLLDYTVDDLGVDWAAFNLHKWIGAPLGTGALYMRRGSLEKVAPHPGESGGEDRGVRSRIHSGTGNFAATLAIPAALDFHEAVGPANKEARLRYLRSLWTSEAGRMSHIEVLGGRDEASWTGIASFRLAGQSSVDDAIALQQRLENEFEIFTVIRKGLDGGACVRITPQVFNSADDIGVLVDALKRLSS